MLKSFLFGRAPGRKTAFFAPFHGYARNCTFPGRRSLLSGAALVLVAPSFAFAQDETIIDSATRVPTPAAQVASSVTLITADQIEARQDKSLPDVLRDVPGLSLVQTGGVGGQTSLFMRGTNSNHTKVLLDGIDISDPSNPTGAADISKLLTGNIARVEVLRGPQSGLYGSDAIGGVINIISKAGEGAFKFNESLEGGSFQTFNQQMGVNGASGAFHYAASLDHVRSGATPVTPLNLLPPGVSRNDDSYDGLMASSRLGYDIADNADLGFVGHYDNGLGHITGDAFNSVTFASTLSPRQSSIETLQYDTRGTAHLINWDGRLDQTLGLGYSSAIIADADPNNGPTRSSGNRTKLDWQGVIKLLDGETLVLGAETARDAMRLPVKAGITTNAGFAELQSSLGALDYSASLRYDDNSRFGDKLTWRAAPTYLFGDTGTRLKASFGSGFKAPSLQQLFGPFGHNPNLKPETSKGYDVGVEQALDMGLSAGITWFHNDIRNLVGYDAKFSPINIGRGQTQGVESFITWQAMPALSLRADYTYTDATDQVAHLELLRRPRHKASLTADWKAMADLSFDATLLVVGPQIDGNRSFSIPRLKMPTYATVNFAANYRLTPIFSLYGRLDNALDTSYQSPDGFLQPGIGAYVGIKANL